MRAVEDDLTLPIVSDEVVGKIPTLLKSFVFGDLLRRTCSNELQHFRSVDLCSFRNLQEPPLILHRRSMTDSLGACNGGMAA